MKIACRPRFAELRWSRVRNAVRLLLPLLRENRPLLLLAAASGFGAMLMRVLKPWPLKVLFDGVLMPTPATLEQPLIARVATLPHAWAIALACLSLLAISMLWGLFASRQAYLTAKAGQHVVFSLRRRVYSHLQRLSLGFHQRRRRGDLVMRLTGDINLLRDMLTDALLTGITEGLVLMVMAAIMLAMNWKLTLVAMLILPLVALTTFTFSVQIRDAARRQRKTEGRVAAMVSEMLGSIHLIQAFGREKHQDRRFRSGNKKSLKAGLRTTRLESAMTRLVEILLAAGTAAVLWLGVHLARSGELTPGDLLVFVSYLGSSYRPLRKLARVSTRLSKAVVCAERVTDVLETAPEVREHPRAKRARQIAGRVQFDRVDFSYRGGARALRRVSFTAEPGQFIGIVGPSGSGKSTLLALLLRLYDPRRGRIRLDGRDLRRFRLQSLRDQYGVVLQEPILFGSTVRDNIAFARPDAGDREIEHCARLAGADGFIDELAEGYDSEMAEAGASLSQGQKQRLSIARSFLKDAPMLLLDEPTNGLDASNERSVEQSLSRLRRGRTTFLVAHKLDLVREADRILVLKRGRLIESGTHEELFQKDGWYARNLSLQQARQRSRRRRRPRRPDLAEVVPLRAGGTKA